MGFKGTIYPRGVLMVLKPAIQTLFCHLAPRCPHGPQASHTDTLLPYRSQVSSWSSSQPYRHSSAIPLPGVLMVLKPAIQTLFCHPAPRCPHGPQASHTDTLLPYRSQVSSWSSSQPYRHSSAIPLPGVLMVLKPAIQTLFCHPAPRCPHGPQASHTDTLLPYRSQVSSWSSSQPYRHSSAIPLPGVLMVLKPAIQTLFCHPAPRCPHGPQASHTDTLLPSRSQVSSWSSSQPYRHSSAISLPGVLMVLKSAL
ncbi:uncharacterized protein LOC127931163 isoform X2 [Oncorhynchus keta]|uniref:uncharacterized protein LOC127931163 isoform X2 n=1 Tax=Oncorhynchus keta TaxID=8018 RepID=UPI00227CF4F5|nr:uncharacterized protein LOC127931163 isoform X2 [Oncorhynchus keta]